MEAMTASGTRWLTDTEQQAWRAFLDVDRLLFDSLDRELQSDAGMSHADYEILVRLSEAPGRQVRMSELAQQTLFSRSRLSHAVARLEHLGWVRRTSCPTDKRGMLAHLTDAGYAELEAAAPGHAAAVCRYIFDALTGDEVAQLHHIAATIRRRLDLPAPGS
jgi:DNA-binding MarR family transcriptional regulator